MEEEIFLEYMQRVKAFQDAAMGVPSLWNGYRNGLRRLQFGSRFGTDGQHTLRMSIPGDHPDLSHREYGRGYRSGYAGLDPATTLDQAGG